MPNSIEETPHDEIQEETQNLDTEQEDTDASTEEDKSALEVLSEGLETFGEDKDTQLEPEDSEAEEVEDGDSTAEVEESHEETEEEYEEEPIPQEQVDIARRLGHTDERIVWLANNEPWRLEEMVEKYSKPDLPQRETKQVDVPKRKELDDDLFKKRNHISLDGLEDLDPEASRIVSALVTAHNTEIDRNNALVEKVKELGEHTNKLDQRDFEAEVRRIDSYFDSMTEHIPELGTTSSLTKEQSKAREEVFGIANILQHTRGIPESAALEEATMLYGLSKVDIDTLEKEAEIRVKEKLNKQKKQFSPRPGGKKRKAPEVTGRDAALDTLTKGLKELL